MQTVFLFLNKVERLCAVLVRGARRTAGGVGAAENMARPAGLEPATHGLINRLTPE